MAELIMELIWELPRFSPARRLTGLTSVIFPSCSLYMTGDKSYIYSMASLSFLILPS